MATITVHIKDNLNPRGSGPVEDGVLVGQLIPQLVEHFKLPRTDNTGGEIVYEMHHNNTILQDKQTLKSAGVKDGDTIQLVKATDGGIGLRVSV